MSNQIAAALAKLDGSGEPAAVRFDDGPPLAGELAVLPSAFNPPTLAHQHLLERAVQLRGIAPLALLTTRNVDKGVYGASLPQRVEMLLALRRDWPVLSVAASNQARIMDQGVSLARSFPEVSTASLTFVVGFDTLERIFARRYYTDMDAELTPFFERHRLLASNRAGMSAGAVRAWVADKAGPFANRIDVIEIDDYPASLSSTAAREALAGGNTHEALPGPVREYIARAGLYRQ